MPTEKSNRHNDEKKDADVTISDALNPKILGSAFGDAPSDLSYRMSEINDKFRKVKSSYFIPGDSRLFSFPSSLYQQLQQAMAQTDGGRSKNFVSNILLSLKSILSEEASQKKCELTLMDCSPFYAGATHLAWCASDAIIIPVRVDEHSIESLDLTLEMLSSAQKDFQMWASSS